MFRRSSKSSQLNFFSSVESLLKGRSLKDYEDTEKWHNQFRIQVTNRIDEDFFCPLFYDVFGAPNASIRVLAGMMILKEARDLSDSQLFENCPFNLLVRCALDLLNIDDTLPVESTYYLLRSSIVAHENETCDNLIEKAFAQVTKLQAIEFQINGSKIRMDSKLLGSNISWYSRYELIHETVRQAYFIAKSQIARLLTESQVILLGRIAGESVDKVLYRSTRSEIETKLTELGQVIYTIINGIDDRSLAALQTLRSVYNEQYQVVNNTFHVLLKQDISASSIQSPHDTDCQHRQKDDQKVKGYSINVTETCDTDHALNLVTNVLVDTAGAADCDFLQTAVEITKEIVTSKIVTVNADGAYHCPENQEYCEENEIDLILGTIQEKPSCYDPSFDENGDLVVTDLNTCTIISSRKVESRREDAEPKWAILNEKNQYRYFTKKEIDTCLLRKQMAAKATDDLNRRNNVEATIFQLGYRYPNAKNHFRGIVKHKMWANLRCFWINFVWIANYVAGGSPYCAQKAVNRWILPRFSALNAKTGLVLYSFLCILTKCGDILSFIFGYPKLIPIFAQNSEKMEF